MKVKLLFILLVLFFVTGCNAEYNLNINDDNSSREELIILDYYNYYDREDVNSILQEFISDSDMSDLSIYFNNSNQLIIGRSKNNYAYLNKDKEIQNSFGKIEIISNKIKFIPNYDTCIFMFMDGGEFVTDDKIKINVTLPFKVLRNNADEVNGNTYTWVYGIENCKKEAYIELNRPYITIAIAFGILLVGAVIFVIVKMKKTGNL